MTDRPPGTGPIQFTEEELREARRGNYIPLAERVKKEQIVRSLGTGPLSKDDIEKLRARP
jgi:hypothetical protein